MAALAAYAVHLNAYLDTSGQSLQVKCQRWSNTGFIKYAPEECLKWNHCTGRYRYYHCSPRRFKTEGELQEETDLPKIEAAANDGDVASQLELGKYYADLALQASDAKTYFSSANSGQEKPTMTSMPSREINLQRSVAWLRKAAMRGNVEAEDMLAEGLLWGNGARRDEIEAVEWFKKAAEQGNLDAQVNLCYLFDGAMRHIEGIGEKIKLDHSQSAKWCKKAAEQGWTGVGTVE